MARYRPSLSPSTTRAVLSVAPTSSTARNTNCMSLSPSTSTGCSIVVTMSLPLTGCAAQRRFGRGRVASGGPPSRAALAIAGLASGAYNHAMLLGRDRERQEIGHAAGAGAAGASATLALAGEPGIGKTALLDYAAGQAADAGLRVLRARGIESEAQIPFGSLLELLRPALGMLDADPASRRRSRWKARWRCGRAGAGTVRRRRRHAQPAGRLRRGGAGGRADRRRALARRIQRPGAAVRLPPAGGRPDRGAARGARGRAVPARRRRPAGAPARRPDQRRGRGPGQRAGPGGRRPAVRRDGRQPARAARTGRRTPRDLALAPEGAPVLVSARISSAFLRRVERARPAPRGGRWCSPRAATAANCRCCSAPRPGSASTCPRWPPRRARDWSRCGPGTVEFRHPLARSAIYADAPAAQRREAHRALAAALPDRDVDRRAWHLAAPRPARTSPRRPRWSKRARAAGGAARYATAAAAFERAGRLAADGERRARLLREAADAGWLAGLADRAVALLDEARAATSDPAELVEIDQLAGHIAIRRGPGDARPRDPDRGRRAGRPRAGGQHARRGRHRLLLRREPGRDAGRRRARTGPAARQPIGARPLPGRDGRWDGADPGRRRGGRRGSRAPGDRAGRELSRAARGSPPGALARGRRRCSCGRPAPGARCCEQARCGPPGPGPRSARCRSCST